MDESRSELERVVATLRGRDSPITRALTAAIDRWRRPPRIQVTGRSRAGKTTVQRALALMSAEETAPVDEPGQVTPALDADLVLYVLGGTLHPADRAAVDGMRSGRILLVLNKADAIGTRWSDAVTAADSYADQLGVPTFPVIATLAAHTRSGILTDADLATLLRHREVSDPSFTLAPERFTSPTFGSDADDRATLLDRWTLPGIAVARAALGHRPDLSPRDLLQILHAATGIDTLNSELQRCYEQLTASRGGEFLDEVARLAADVDPDSSDVDLIERYLHSEEARAIALRAGLSHPALHHLTPARPDPADATEALAHAARWRAATSGDLPPDARRAALRIHDGYVRLWERMTDARL